MWFAFREWLIILAVHLAFCLLHFGGRSREAAPCLEGSSSELIFQTTILASRLINKFVCVAVHPVLWRERRFIEVVAVTAAFTWLDEHGRLLEALAVRADKSHRHGVRTARRAAAAVRTHTAVVWSVETNALTFSVGKGDRLWGFLRWGAVLTFLWKIKKCY